MILPPGCGKIILVLLLAGSFSKKNVSVCIIAYNDLLEM